MNRHFISYNAIPTEPLGEPIRKESPPSEKSPSLWTTVPNHPDYFQRTLPSGEREISHKNNLPGLAEDPLRLNNFISPNHPLLTITKNPLAQDGTR
jgi:hypothetical protein